MKTIIRLGVLGLAMLLTLSPLSALATTNSNSETKNYYYSYVSVSGTLTGGHYTGVSFDNQAICTSGYNHCGSSGVDISLSVQYLWVISGTEYCSPSCSSYAVAHGPGTGTLDAQGSINGNPTVNEAFTQGQSGYYYTSNSTYRAVTDLIDAGLPYN